MLKRWAIAAIVAVAALFLIDRASLLVAPCSEYGSSQDNQKSANDDNCAVHEGIIVAGIERLFETPPDVWTALATIAIAGFTWTLWQSNEKMWKLTLRSVEIAEKSLLAANNPIVTIGELELRDADEVAQFPHIHWGIRNAGPGLAVIHTVNTRAIIITVEGAKISRVRSQQKVNWIGSIESKEAASGMRLTTPELKRRINEIRHGGTILLFEIELGGQNIFKDHFTARFPFEFDPKSTSFRRIGTFDQLETRYSADSETKE
jgi:hypothetical protein